MPTDMPEDCRTDDADESNSDFPEATLFDLDPPVRPYDVHLGSLDAAATTLNDAHNAVQSAEEQLTQVPEGVVRSGWASAAPPPGDS